MSVSPITSCITGNSYSWPDLSAAPDLYVAGLGYPTNVFENLPATNRNALPLTAGSTTLVPGSNLGATIAGLLLVRLRSANSA